MPRTNKNIGRGNIKPLKMPSLPESFRQTPLINEQLASPSPAPIKQRRVGKSRPSEDKTSTQEERKGHSDDDMEEEEEEEQVSYERFAEAYISSRETIRSPNESLTKHVEWFRGQMENFKLLLPGVAKDREKAEEMKLLLEKARQEKNKLEAEIQM